LGCVREVSQLTDLTVKTSERLVTAAARLVHEKGVGATTLAQVATAAEVPLGNVFYYFKTKGALIDAVVEARVTELQRQLEEAEADAVPLERLVRVLDAFASGAKTIVRLGCPRGSLASELQKDDAGHRPRVQELFLTQIDWFRAQFEALSVPEPKLRAIELLCAIQGACLVGHALGDPALFEARIRGLAAALRSEFST
jgi:TetR/AcrR family transcriptional regulator, transcriptional repressor for nem operon